MVRYITNNNQTVDCILEDNETHICLIVFSYLLFIGIFFVSGVLVGYWQLVTDLMRTGAGAEDDEERGKKV